MQTRIRKLRQDNSYTQEYLAMKVGITQTSLSRIDTISTAMELRGFGKNKTRTWYTRRPFAKSDYAVMALRAALLPLSLGVTIRYGRFYSPFM